MKCLVSRVSPGEPCACDGWWIALLRFSPSSDVCLGYLGSSMYFEGGFYIMTWLYVSLWAKVFHKIGFIYKSCDFLRPKGQFELHEFSSLFESHCHSNIVRCHQFIRRREIQPLTYPCSPTPCTYKCEFFWWPSSGTKALQCLNKDNLLILWLVIYVL